jgi:hypothetical protein
MSCRQAASPAMHESVIQLIQIGASLPRQDPDAILEAMSLVHERTAKRVTDSIRRRADERFHEAIKALSQFRFVDLVVEAETVHLLKTIPCLLTNPHCLSSPRLLDLRENRNFNMQDYAELLGDLVHRVDSSRSIVGT